MANRYILLNSAMPPSSAAGLIYPVWKISGPTSFEWGLMTSAAGDNQYLRTTLEKLRLVEDASNGAWTVYTWPFTPAFDGSTLLSAYPNFGSPADITGLDAWKLPAGTQVFTQYTFAGTETNTDFNLLKFRPTAPSAVSLGPVGSLVNASFVWHFGTASPVIAADRALNLPADLFLFRYEDGWGGPLKLNNAPFIAGVTDRLSDNAGRRSILKLADGSYRLELRFDAPFSPSYFGNGICQITIAEASINLGFGEEEGNALAVYLHDPAARAWLNVRVDMSPITAVGTKLPSLVIPTGPPAAAFELKFALGGWDGAPLAGDLTGPALLPFQFDDRVHSRGGFEFNPDVFRHDPAHSVVDLVSILSDVAGSDLDLSDLAEGADVAIKLSQAPVNRIPMTLIDGDRKVRIPLLLALDAGPLLGRLSVVLCLDLDLVSLRLVVPATPDGRPEGRIDSFLATAGNTDDIQLLDLKASAFKVPSRAIDFATFATRLPDGYFDSLTHQFVLLQRTDPAAPPAPSIAFPGDLASTAGTFDGRLELKLRTVNFKDYAPDHPLAQVGIGGGYDGVLLAVGKEGVTFHAELKTQQSIELMEATASLKSVELRALPNLPNGDASEILMIDSGIVKAQVAFEMDLPGFENASIAGTFELRRTRRDGPPSVVATFDVRPNDPPVVGELGSKFFEAELTRIAPVLSWEAGKWKVSVRAWGFFAIADRVDGSAAGTFKDEARLTFEALELTNLHKPDDVEVTVSISRRDPAIRFSLLGGKLRCRMGQLGIGWRLGTGRVMSIDCRDVSFDVGSEASLRVGFDTGRLLLKCDAHNNLSASFPESVRLRVTVGSTFSFTGEASYKRPEPRIPYGEIGASGEVEVGGINAAVTLKLAVVKKQGGALQAALVLGGGKVINKQISPVICVYSFLAGAAVNYRLRGISSHPTATQLVENIDRLDPEILDNWDLVVDDGIYGAVFGKALLTTTVTQPTVPNAYVATLLVSVDSQLRFLGAGRMWISSSIDFAKGNLDRPVLLGGVAFLPREQELSLHLETRRNPAIQNNPQLELMLHGAKGTLDFVAARNLADIQVRVNFREDLFGIKMTFDGGLRLAIFAGAVLAKAWFQASASFEKRFERGAAGIVFNANFSASTDYRMLLQGNGITGYAHVDQSLDARVEAWMEIEVLVWVERSVKKLLEWVTQREQEVQMSRISGRISAHLRFNGTAGLLSDSGEAGFAGTVSIGGSLRGHSFGIDVDLNVKDGVVTTALKRLEKYERRLDQAIADTFGRFALGGAPSKTNANPSELWAIHSERRVVDGKEEIHFLPLPQRYGKWFLGPVLAVIDADSETPQFEEHVTKIEFYSGGTLIHELFPFWIWPVHRLELEVEEQRRAQRAETAFFPTSGHPSVTPTHDHIVRDPRLESRARAYWREADRLSYPDFAAPARFAPLEELAANPDLPGLSKIIEYERKRLAAAQAERVRAEDLEEPEQLERAKGGLVFGLDEELNGRADSPRFESISLPPNGAVTRELGLIARIPKAVAISIDNVRVHRSEGLPVDIPTDSPQPATPPPQFRALPWGLDFVEAGEEQRELGVTGAVVVRLPLFIPDYFLHLDGDGVGVTALGGVDIFRRLPGEPPQRIARGVLPGVTRVLSEDTTEMYSFPEPFIYSDAFPVRGDAFVDGRILEGRTPVLYSFEVRDLRGDSLGVGQWSPVRLFIPADSTLPSNLCVVVAMEQLNPERTLPRGHDAADERLEITLCTLKDGVAKPLPFSDSEVELHVEEKPTLLSGFYTGDEFRPGEPRPNGLLDDVRGDSRSESLGEKFRLFSLQGDRGRFTVARDDLHAGCRYRFFVRLATRNEDMPVLPAEVGLVPHTDDLANPEKVEAARRLEWPAIAGTLGSLPKKKFSADAIVFRERNWVRVKWDARERSYGGAELILIDRHDPSLIVRQRVEVFSRDVFLESQQDFSSATGWTVESASLGRLRTPGPRTPVVPKNIEEYYADLLVLKERDLIKDLVWTNTDGPAGKLYDHLARDERHWQTLYRLSVPFLRALSAFGRSPLNSNDAGLRSLNSALPDLLTAMLVGISTGSMPSPNPPPAAIDLPAARAAFVRDVLAQLQALYLRLRTEQFARLTAVDEKTSFNAFFDALALAKPGVACLKRRWNLARELLVERRIEPPATPAVADRESLLRGKHFQRLRDNFADRLSWYKDEMPATPLISDFLFKSGLFEVDGKRAATDMKDFLIALADHLTIGAYPREMANSVTRASGIAQYLDNWQVSLSDRGVQLITRAHHQAGVERPVDATARLTETELESFRPDYLFEGDNFPADPAVGVFNRHTDEQVAKGAATWFNFCERMGFATDVAARDASGKPVDQETLLASLPKKTATGHRLLLGAGVALHALAPEQARIGYGFIHVAVVPEEFLQLLLGLTAQASIPAAGDPDPAFDRVREWLAFRNIKLPSVPSEGRRIVYALAEIAGLVVRAPFKDETNPADKTPLLRLDRRTTSPQPIPLVDGATALVEIPDHWGHEIEVLVAPLSRYERLQERLDRDRSVVIPWDDLEDWAHRVRFAPLSPSADSQLEDASAMTPFVFGYPHRTRIQFIYRPSDYGRRSLVNQIAEVRTGFRGTDLRFTFTALDRSDDRRWGIVLKYFESLSGAAIAVGRLWKTPLGEGSRRLPVALGSERLVVLEHLTPCFSYRLIVSDCFEGPADLKPPTAEDNVELTRRPSLLAFRQPKLEASAAVGGQDLAFTLFPTSHADELTDLEAANTPPDLDIARPRAEGNVGPAPMSMLRLPDLAMAYRIYYRHPNGIGSDVEGDGPSVTNSGPRAESYVLAAIVVLPWHPAYRMPSNDEPRVVVRSMNDLFKPSDDGHGAGNYSIKYQGNPTDPTALISYVVQFKAFVPDNDGELFREEARFRMQAIRGDAEADVLVDFTN